MVFLYDLFSDKTIAIGLSILILTLAIKFALFSMNTKAIVSQRELQKLQPKLNDIKEKYKKDKEKQSREMMKFYKENKINPFSSCLPLLIQLPILIALYRVFRDGITNPDELKYLYPFVLNPGHIEANFLGIFDFAAPNIVLAVIAGVLQFAQTWMLTKMKTKREKKEEIERKKKKKKTAMDTATAMTQQMTYFMPIMTVFIAASLPSGLAFYWVITTLFAIGQQWYIMKKKEELDRMDEEAEKNKLLMSGKSSKKS